MSRFTETHFAHAFETATETWWGDWRCVCGHEGRTQNAADMPWPLKRLAIRRAHAAHVESMLVEAGVVAVELPEADADNELYDQSWSMRSSDLDEQGPRSPRIELTEGEIRFHCIPIEHMRPDMGRWLAAALLAAAVRPATPEEPRCVCCHDMSAHPLGVCLEGCACQEFVTEAPR